MRVAPAGTTPDWRILGNGRMWLAAVMGFAAGLPVLLTLTVLQAWLTSAAIDLTIIGVLGLIALPYNIKFLWAPVMDRFNPLGLGRRRSWLVITQLALALSIASLGLQDPAQTLSTVIVAACIVTLFSASQDIVIDAYRRESLAESEQGLGASMYVYGYRLGTLLASAGGLILADLIGFSGVYLLMAAIMLSMVGLSILAPEPTIGSDGPQSLRAAFVDPFIEFFHRNASMWFAVAILLFVLLYNLGVHLCGHMAIPFFLATGFSNSEIGAITTVFGIGPFLAGVLAGGVLQVKVGLRPALMLTSALKATAIGSFAGFAVVGQSLSWLAIVMGMLNLAVGMGTALLMAFIANLTDARYTATQFALFTALAALPRSTLTAPTGWMATEVGWTIYFIFCASMAIPGLVMLLFFKNHFDEVSPAATRV